jgi:broad specificity phosphatase PhoE
MNKMKEESKDRVSASNRATNRRRTRKGQIILVRHGESEGNRTRTFTHSPTVNLTERGRDQARTAAEHIGRRYGAVQVVSSPFTRALETARIIAELLGLPVEVEPVWREQSLGRLAGRSYDCVLEDPGFDPDRTWAWRPPDGESLEDVRARVAPAVDALVNVSAGRDIVLVSHAGVMQAIWAHVTGQWRGAPVPTNTAIAVLEHSDGQRPTIRFDPAVDEVEKRPHATHRDMGRPQS